MQTLASQFALALSRSQPNPHEPQLVGLVARFVSQPFVGSPSQSPKPGRQGPRLHVLSAQAGSALANGAHVVPHAAQFFASFAVSTSQPSLGSPLQFAKPFSQPVNLQTPARQVATLPGIAQLMSHVPQ